MKKIVKINWSTNCMLLKHILCIKKLFFIILFSRYICMNWSCLIIFQIQFSCFFFKRVVYKRNHIIIFKNCLIQLNSLDLITLNPFNPPIKQKIMFHKPYTIKIPIRLLFVIFFIKWLRIMLFDIKHWLYRLIFFVQRNYLFSSLHLFRMSFWKKKKNSITRYIKHYFKRSRLSFNSSWILSQMMNVIRLIDTLLLC